MSFTAEDTTGLPPRPTFNQDFTSPKILQPLGSSMMSPDNRISSNNLSWPPPSDPSQPPQDGHSPILALPVELIEMILDHTLERPKPAEYGSICNHASVVKLHRAGKHLEAHDHASTRLVRHVELPLQHINVDKNYMTIARNLYFKTRTFEFKSAKLLSLLLRKPAKRLRWHLWDVASVTMALPPVGASSSDCLQQLLDVFPNVQTLRLTNLMATHLRFSQETVPRTRAGRRTRGGKTVIESGHERLQWVSKVLEFKRLRALDVSPAAQQGSGLSDVSAAAAGEFAAWVRREIGQTWGIICDNPDAVVQSRREDNAAKPAGRPPDSLEHQQKQAKQLEKAAAGRIARAQQADEPERGLQLSDVLNQRQIGRFT